MQRKFLVWLSLLMIAFIVVIPQIVTGQPVDGFPGMMGHGSMGNGSDVQTIHQLFADHDQIHRTVEDIPNGIRAVTESDNPAIATLLQSHVSEMYEHVSAGQPIPMIGMSATLPAMVHAKNQYQRQLRLTAKGVEVTETSNDPDLVAVIQAHAREVTQFAEQGMPGMMGGMMRRQ